jgi:hypothetical protein
MKFLRAAVTAAAVATSIDGSNLAFFDMVGG